MTESLETLWRPLQVGSLEVPNRILVSAHGTQHETDRYAAYLGARAKGGAGLLVTGAIPVHPSSLQSPEWMWAWKPETASAYRVLGDTVRENGGHLFAQLYHVGHQDLGTTPLDEYHAVVSAGDLPSPIFGVQSHVLATDEIEEVVAAFGSASRIAVDGGLDGVEIHAAHGYLLHEFLSPLTNQREDQYGGSPANRARIVIEIGRAVRKVTGPDYPVGLKLSFEEFVGPRAMTPEHAVETLACIHAERLYDYVSISGAAYHALHQLVAPVESGQSGHLAGHAEAAKSVVGDLPVMVTGAVRDLDRAAEIVSSGQADMVGMVRAHLADPEIVNKAREGRADEIRPCVGANQGCWRRAFRGQKITCTVNPEAGREVNGPTPPADTPLNVAVVGGGPAGLKAAEATAKAGHRVTLYERESELGGQLRAAGALPGRQRWQMLVDHLAASIDRLGVEVRTGFEADAGALAEADAVVLATGSSWRTDGASILRPDRGTIPGIETATLMTPFEVAMRPGDCGRRVLIFDEVGNYTALGLADLLSSTGHEVLLATPMPQIGIQTGPLGTADLPWIYPKLLAAGVEFAPEATIESLDAAGAELAHTYGTWQRRADADTVILISTRKAEDGLYRELQGAGKVSVLAIGDCFAPREVDDAMVDAVRVPTHLAAAGTSGTPIDPLLITT
jgi:2,4-dienoyl-CoA reductase-like NADH-dependent reductase (Old Yellow Enzyme family)